MKAKRIMWTKELVLAEALKYPSRRKFQKACQSAYNFARRNNILDEVCSHMKSMIIKWTKELVLAEALKYSSKTEFKDMNKSAYQYIVRNNFIGEACGHMEIKYILWNHNKAFKEATKYNTRSDFFKYSPGAYCYCTSFGILDEACSHMKVKWTKEIVHKESLKYNTRTEFSNGSSNAYRYALKYNLLDEVCSHMDIIPFGGCGRTAYETLSSTLYIIEIFEKDGIKFEFPVLKPGLASIGDNCYDRVYNRYRYENIKYNIILTEFFVNGVDAWDIEQSIKDQSNKYLNINPIFSHFAGKTELRNIVASSIETKEEHDWNKFACRFN